MTRRRLVTVGVVLVLVLVLGMTALGRVLTPDPGLAEAAEDAGFVSCVEETGVTLTGADETDREQEGRLWAEPGVLACAATELDDDQLDEALQRVFEAPRGPWLAALIGDNDTEGTLLALYRMIRQLVADVTTGVSERSDVVAKVARVLARVPSDETSYRYLRGTLDVAALSILAETEDRIPGYDALLEETSQPDNTLAYLEFLYRGSMTSTPEGFGNRFDDLTDELEEAADAADA